jgi:tryptophan synthase alpha chain
MTRPNQLRAVLDALRQRGEKALGLFLTSGFPEPEATLPILRVIDEGGADFIELGMPFSDPLAEGLPIQHASARALARGVTMADTFRTAEAFRAQSETPLVLMGYVNPILRYGVAAFCHDAAAAGADGLILPDLPPEEAGLIEEEAAANGLALTFLIAPNTPDARVRLVGERSTGFVYATSVTGLTGTQIVELDAVSAYLNRARDHVGNNPLLVGFGIQTRADAERLGRAADGVIVGSALIRLAERLWDDTATPTEVRLERLAAFARDLKAGLIPVTA